MNQTPDILTQQLADAEKALAAAVKAGDFEEIGRLTDVVNALTLKLQQAGAR